MSRRFMIATLCAGVAIVPAGAQFGFGITVYDPTNWAELVKQLTQLQQQYEQLVQTYVEAIDAGEAEAIVLAIELKATLLIDEVAGRTAAAAAGVPYMGVLGVLSLAKRQKLISEVRPLLDRLRLELRFRIAQNLYDQFLKAIGEL